MTAIAQDRLLDLLDKTAIDDQTRDRIRAAIAQGFAGSKVLDGALGTG